MTENRNGTRAERRRQQSIERKLDRAFKRLAERDVCSFCGQHFRHNSSTAFGLRGDEPVLACELCVLLVEKVRGVGLYSDRDYDFLHPGKEANHHDSDARYEPEDTIKAITLRQKVISHMDAAVADAEKRGGAHRKRPVSMLDHPWKEDDRVWFERHPDRAHRARLPYPGEDEVCGGVSEPTPEGHQMIVLLRQIKPGVRLKNGFYLNAEMLPVPEDEAFAHALFDLVERGGAFNGDDLGALIEKYLAVQRV